MTDMKDDGPARFSGRDALMLAGGVLVGLVAVAGWQWWTQAELPDVDAQQEQGAAASPNEVTISRDVLAAAGIELGEVTERHASERLQAVGVVEPNQLQIQQITSLIAGRVERVAVALGDRVQAGQVLLTLSSPHIAELQGNLRSAEARLAEAETTFSRANQLVELGATAGKESVAAETELRTAQAQVGHLRQSLRALGAAADGATGDVTIRAPMTGTVIDRTVNPGAWIEAGASPLRIANLATVWVIVNVPEARLTLVRIGAPVEIRAPALGARALPARVGYIDPQLAQDTRTARVRVEVPNRDQTLKIGMFVDVTLQGATATLPELVVPAGAVQRIGERIIVFVPTSEPGGFEVRDVDVGDEVQGMRVVRQGLVKGERVVTKGGFTLKSQLLKGQFGEEEEIANQ